MIYNQEYKDSHGNRIAKRLRKYKDEILTFAIHSEVSPDNNHAERQIRSAVIRRKNSCCNHFQRGIQTQAILMSIFRTLPLYQIDPITAITHLLFEWIKTGNIVPSSAVSLQMAE